MNFPRRTQTILMALLGLLTLLLGSACGRLIPAGGQSLNPAHLRAGAYALDPAHTAVLWKVDHLGFSQYVGRFGDVAGSLDFDPGQPEVSVLSVVIGAASIDTGDPAFDQVLAGSDWLNADHFPQITYTAQSAQLLGPDRGTVFGTLTLAGVSAEVPMTVIFNGGAFNWLIGRETLGFAARMRIDRTAFGIDTLAPAIGAEVEIEIHTEFVARSDN
jgi:polyisoprenoid-binding protein YceI